MLGKTEFAKSLCGPDATFELTCTTNGTAEPNLRGFDRSRHKSILFDERHVDTVIANKKLFQAPPCMLQMAQSATNCHSYEICLHGIMLVICTNCWTEELAQQPHHHREWLVQNSVLVHVTEPLWQTTSVP